MSDIARGLDVSVVTVSKVLRNQGNISAATRKRVLQRAKKLNYQANWIARSLVTGRTFTIGLLLPDIQHPFFAEIAKAVAETVRPHGYHVIISYFEEDPELAGESAAHIARQASLFTPSSLLRMLEILSEAERESKTANQQRLLLEMTLLRLMLQPAPAQMPAAAASSDTSATTSPQPRPVAERPAPTPVPRTERPTGLPPRATDRTNNGAPAVSRPAEPVQAPGAPAPAAHAAPVEPSAASTNSGATHQQLRAAEPVESTPIIAPVGRIDADNQLEYLSGHWQEVIHHFQAASPSGVKVIMDARPVEQTGKTFTVAFTQKAYVDLLESPKRKSFLEGILDKVLRADKGTYRVRIILA